DRPAGRGRARSNIAWTRYAAAAGRYRQPARAAVALDQGPHWQPRARTDDACGRPDPGRPRRRGRRGRARHCPESRPDRRCGAPPTATTRLFPAEGEGAQPLLLTPHTAGFPRQSSAYLFRAAWQNVERVVLRGEPALHRAY